jgi:hypothetical protein
MPVLRHGSILFECVAERLLWPLGDETSRIAISGCEAHGDIGLWPARRQMLVGRLVGDETSRIAISGCEARREIGLWPARREMQVGDARSEKSPMASEAREVGLWHAHVLVRSLIWRDNGLLCSPVLKLRKAGLWYAHVLRGSSWCSTGVDVLTQVGVPEGAARRGRWVSRRHLGRVLKWCWYMCLLCCGVLGS